MKIRTSTSRRPQVYALITSLVVMVLILVNILVSAQAADWGYQLSQLTRQQAHLEAANQMLRTDLAKQTSLTRLSSLAPTLGYRADVALLQLTPVSTVALKTSAQP
ncbi:hypothetical protein A2W24_05830 [Microgenomates group bacterium RBG_16_45_19]|nr:MAG: hypothetical protein A2W24_05830 [Microgenomates group bacterium RBG_16_45_19]